MIRAIRGQPKKSPAEPQAQNVQEATEQDLELRSSQASNLVKKHVIVVMGASLVPIPLFDLVALSGVQLKMLHGLAKLYEVPFSKNLGKSSIASLLGGVMPTSTAMTLLDFDPKNMRTYFSSKLEEGKAVAADLKPGKTQTSGS